MTGQRIMKKLRAGIGVLLGGLFVLTLSAQDITTTSENPTVVVGTFDSRAVAVAYVQSDAFRDYLVVHRSRPESLVVETFLHRRPQGVEFRDKRFVSGRLGSLEDLRDVRLLRDQVVGERV